MKPLFVDDEPRVVEALERTVSDLEEGWSVISALSGSAALHELARTQFDVVVTDIRMPGMDGAMLLEEIQKRYPRILRLVLSGQNESSAAFRAFRVAHQFLAKPCSASVLVDTIRRVEALQARIGSERVRELVSGMARLPCIPAVHIELQRVLADPKVDVDAVAAVLMDDPALVAKLLQVVNSSYFSRGRVLTDIHAAVIRLGLDTVSALAFVVGAFDVVALSGASRARIVEVQQHSMRAAAIAREIAPPELACDAFVAALLCDVGSLILSVAERNTSAHVDRESTCESPMSGPETELATFGVTHAEVGAYVLALWGLPQHVVDAVATHHDPSGDPRGEAGLSIIVHIAHALASGVSVDAAYFEKIGAHGNLANQHARAQKLLTRMNEQ